MTSLWRHHGGHGSLISGQNSPFLACKGYNLIVYHPIFTKLDINGVTGVNSNSISWCHPLLSSRWRNRLERRAHNRKVVGSTLGLGGSRTSCDDESTHIFRPIWCKVPCLWDLDNREVLPETEEKSTVNFNFNFNCRIIYQKKLKSQNGLKEDFRFQLDHINWNDEILMNYF